MEELLTDLLTLEKGFWGAAGGDGSYYDEYFADNGRLILPFEGGILNKSSVIDSVKNSPAWDDFTLQNPELLPISDDETVLIYEAFARRNGQSDYHALISSLYVKSDSWRLWLHQQTAI